MMIPLRMDALLSWSTGTELGRGIVLHIQLASLTKTGALCQYRDGCGLPCRQTTAFLVLLSEVLIFSGALPFLDIHQHPWQAVWEVVPMELAAIYHIYEAFTDGHRIEHQIVACTYSALAASTAAMQLQVQRDFIPASCCVRKNCISFLLAFVQARVNAAVPLALIMFVVSIALKNVGPLISGDKKAT